MESKLPSELAKLVKGLGTPKILVLGDLMVDKYVWGTVERTSPEAPIPVLNATADEVRPGGSANVVNNLVTLGAEVLCCGVIGADSDGRELRKLLGDMNVDTAGMVATKDRPTTVKVRLMGHVETATRSVQQLLRVDYERRSPIGDRGEKRLCAFIEKHAGEVDAVLISDMAKGVCSPKVLRSAIDSATRAGVEAIVDPRRDGQYARYWGATAITPNRMETQHATGITLDTIESVRAAATKLMNELEVENVVITLDRDGAFLYPRNGEPRHIATQPRDVYDVTGAGDMVLSVLGMVTACRCSFGDALALANVASGIEVGKIGCMPVTRHEIVDALLEHTYVPPSKIRTLEQLLPEVNERRRRGEKCAFTNGCFDMLHLGHINTIKFARGQGDFLVVGINSDRSIRQQKGPNRPILNEHERAGILAGLEEVDYIVVFDDVSVLPLIKKVKPDVLVKGGDVGEAGVVGREFVEASSGKVELAPIIPGISTTNIVTRVLQKYQNGDQVAEDQARSARETKRRSKKRKKSR